MIGLKSSKKSFFLLFYLASVEDEGKSNINEAACFDEDVPYRFVLKLLLAATLVDCFVLSYDVPELTEVLTSVLKLLTSVPR